MKEDITQKLDTIDKRLQQLRRDWLKASPSMRKYIEAGAKLYKDKQLRLQNKQKNDAQAKLV